MESDSKKYFCPDCGKRMKESVDDSKFFYCIYCLERFGKKLMIKLKGGDEK